MSLQQYSNDTSREARSGVWHFDGRYTALLVASAAAFISILKSLVIFLDWPIAALIALVPFGLATLFVCKFINGKPKSYASDWLLLAVWKLKTAAYLAGAKDRPSTLWIGDRVPKHPKAT